MTNTLSPIQIAEAGAFADDSMITSQDPQASQIVTIEHRAITWRDGLIGSLRAIAEDAKAISVAGHAGGEKAGAKAVREMRLRIRSQRLPIQNEAKAMKDIGRGIVKKVSEFENELLKIITPEEERLQSEEDAYEHRQEQIKREVEEMQKQILNIRIATMHEMGVSHDYEFCATATDAEWDARLPQWQSEAALRREKQEAETRAMMEAYEAEKARKAAQDAELAAARAETERLKSELKAIDDKRIAKQLEKERKAKAEEAKKAKELAAMEAAEIAAALAPDLDKLALWRSQIIMYVNRFPIPDFDNISIKKDCIDDRDTIIEMLRNKNMLSGV